MDEQIRRQLVDLNAHFYREFGGAFSATRQRIQPGISQAISYLPMTGRWLDLGCGNGSLAHWLAKNGFAGDYLGLDFSPALLAEANRERLPEAFDFRLVDLTRQNWTEDLPLANLKVIVSFAALHHLPGADFRKSWLAEVAGLLAPGGFFAFSVWQFQNSPKLLARRLPWERVGLQDAQLDFGDTLLDWRYALPGQAEKVGLRYVHLFSGEELAELARTCGFVLQHSFESDGQGGRLGLYQIWRKPD